MLETAQLPHIPPFATSDTASLFENPRVSPEKQNPMIDSHTGEQALLKARGEPGFPEPVPCLIMA